MYVSRKIFIIYILAYTKYYPELQPLDALYTGAYTNRNIHPG